MRAYQEKTIAFYDTHVEEYKRNTDPTQDTRWLERFCALLPAGGKVLDHGCAYGRDCGYFASHGFATVGIDLSDAMIARAQKQAPQAQFMQMDILALAFPDKTFDGIWSSGSLLHLTKEDAKVALREAARVLKRGGYLYLNLKEGEGEGVVRDARYAGEEKYYAFYSEGELRKMLSEQELAVLDVEIAKAEGYRTTRTIYMLARKPPVMP